MPSKKVSSLVSIFSVAMLLSMVGFAFGDDTVPVYDADNYSPSFDSNQTIYGGGNVTTEDATYSPLPATPREIPLSPAQRMAKVEQQVKNLQQAQAVSKIETLQTEVQTLRGQIEQITRQLNQTQTQQKKLYADLDKRINQKPSPKQTNVAEEAQTASSTAELLALRAEVIQLRNQLQQQKTVNITSSKVKKSAPPPAESPPAALAISATVQTKTSDQPNVAEEQQIYQTAYDLIKSKKYNDAILSLQKMLQKYPTGQFAANAHYWLGELYGILGKNSQSAVEFAAVVKNYPDSPKVSDAQLKLGLIYTAQFKWSEAKLAFKKVINRYPGTASARLAAEQIKQIREAGH